MNLKSWEKLKEEKELCLCGHLMEKHIEFWGACRLSRCSCIEYETSLHTQERGTTLSTRKNAKRLSATTSPDKYQEQAW